MFVDRVTIRVEGGTGGSGAEAFRREAKNPMGGPSGGDGGDGGEVVLICDPQLSTLLDFKYRSEYQAERGGHGEGNDRAGRDGEDIELRAPPGTIVRDADTGELVGELLHDGERLVVAAGGRGGRGNAQFATPTRQAPTYWEPGKPGVVRRIELTPEAHRGRGARREAKCGEVDFPRSRLGGTSESRGLPVHDPSYRTSGSSSSQTSVPSSWPTFPGSSRVLTRGGASAIGFCSTSSGRVRSLS